MQITFKAWNIIRYQSYDKKKSLARWQHVWMFSLFTMFKGSLLTATTFLYLFKHDKNYSGADVVVYLKGKQFTNE